MSKENGLKTPLFANRFSKSQNSMSETKDYKSKQILIKLKPGAKIEFSGQSETRKRGAGGDENPAFEYPSRRRKKSGGIRFFDLALKNNNQLYAAKFPPLLLSNLSDLEIDPPATISPGDFNDLLGQIYAWIFSVPQNDWVNRFKKLTKTDYLLSDVFVKYIDDTNGLTQTSIGNFLNGFAKFEDDSLKLSASESASLQIRGIFNSYSDKYINLAAPQADIKITGEFDSAADSVEFVPSSVMDIFLVPSIVRVSAETKYRNGLHVFVDGGGTHSDLVEYHDFLFAGFQVLDRTWFKLWLDSLNQTFYQSNYNFWQSWKTYPGAIMKRGKRDFNDFPPYSYFNSYTDQPISNFPFSTLYTPTGLNETAETFNNAFGNSILSPGNVATRLIYVIKQNNRFFYVWDVV